METEPKNEGGPGVEETDLTPWKFYKETASTHNFSLALNKNTALYNDRKRGNKKLLFCFTSPNATSTSV